MIRTSIHIFLFALLSAGCLPDPLSRPEAGKTIVHTAGSPDFDMEVFEEASDSASGILLTLRIPHSSLIFTRSGSGTVAHFEYRVRIVPAEDSSGMVDEIYGDSLRAKDAPLPGAATLKIRRYRLSPGTYRLDVELRDLNTGASALRSQRAEVFSLSDGCAHISRFRLFQRTRGQRLPYLPFYIPEDADSLEAVVDVHNPAALQERKLSATLISYGSDTSFAAPPHYFSPNAWNLSYRGVGFDKPETVWVRSLNIRGDTTASFHFPFGRIPRGLHELILEGVSNPCGSEDEPLPVRRRGYLVVFGAGFPHLTTIPQLIGPLAYIARPEEIQEILSAKTSQEQRSVFDRFWLRNAGSPESARNAIRQYYLRVEEANVRFSAYKEGWKTDKGMIYVVFGPPAAVELTFRAESWDYENGYRFTFRWTNPRRLDEPVRVEVLNRNMGYEQVWQKAVERIRSGNAF